MSRGGIVGSGWPIFGPWSMRALHEAAGGRAGGREEPAGRGAAGGDSAGARGASAERGTADSRADGREAYAVLETAAGVAVGAREASRVLETAAGDPVDARRASVAVDAVGGGAGGGTGVAARPPAPGADGHDAPAATHEAGAAGGGRHRRARRKRTLGALALALAATAVAVGSGADFTARTANPSNTFTAGSLSMDNSRDGAVIFAGTGMKPGGPAETGLVDIKNSGSVDGVFSLTRDQLTSTDGGVTNPTPFASKVNVKIVDCGKYAMVNNQPVPNATPPTCGDPDDVQIYNGTLGGESSSHGLGVFRPGEQHRYQFGASLDSSAGNEYANDGSSARYVWDAVQTP